MSVQRLHVVIHGRVQGVGFRWATQAEAKRLGLTGWVRNLSNGDVEAEFHGDEETLRAIRRWCGHGPSMAHVDSIAETWGDSSERLKSFRIR